MLQLPVSTPSRLLLAVLLTAGLTACGGGSSDADQGQATELSTAPAASGVGSTSQRSVMDEWADHAESGQTLHIPSADENDETVLLGKAARLSRQELQRKAGAAKRAEATAAVAPKALSGLVPAYRFFNTQTTAHFFTINPQERDQIIATLPQFRYEGQAFEVSAVAQPGLAPVYRFLNTATGVHLFTISEDEKAYILATLPKYRLEGVAYYASPVGGVGFKPMFRFYRPDKNFHFYTADYTERDNVISNLCSYRYEGTGYYVPDAAATTEPPAAKPASVVLVVGDSLGQGYGVGVSGRSYGFVTPGKVWTEVLAKDIKSRTGRACNRVVNVSVGGMRTDHGLAGIQGWLDRYAPTHVILAQGTNDAWQNKGVASMKANLGAMAQASLAADARVYVMDFLFYPKGTAYRQGMTAMYQEVAANNQATFFSGSGSVPFNGTYYHSDNVHLKDAAQPKVKEAVWQALLPTL